ncbi:polyamine transporter [Laccaria bicolor S238N-H82]|uniref:Polyamine transporter n=1 Tax=Laccaria bicolor (strain S238N-H82 / ATCC MYA-4686) TaxID=486041 RepID=B0DGU8_LACBS|nr:polyamine transporter [Laccaria bicolor S238N-H82]EDR06334.1 polyamine transporter [Laccaria bicolor S238N-H82]|eukprot:XP_001883195.1 polyamine transporter [Laccaria bicolor S238N-H82]
MPSEPIEAEFISPPALLSAQEDDFRILHSEGPPTRQSSPDTAVAHCHDVKLKERSPRDEFGAQVVRSFITVATSFLCLAVAVGSSIVTGDMVGPTKTLHIQQTITNLTVTCFVMGFGLGPLFLAPLSEVFGRRPIYCISIFLYFIFTLPSALAKNGATLVVARMIAGLCASAPICNVGGTIADVWAVENRGAPMALFSGTLFMGPCIGPMIGGWIGMRAGWRWIYWVLFIFIGVCFIFTFFIPETLAPVILRKKAEKLRKETGDDKYRTLEELEKLPFSETLKIALIRPFIMILTEPIVIFMSIYLSFVYSLLYLLFFAFPIAFSEIRGFSDGMTGITFVSIMLGILGALALVPVQEKLYKNATRNGSYPEARLFPMMAGAFIMPTALFIFAFTGAYRHVHWMGPIVSGVVFGFAMILLYVSANSYIIDSYSNCAATAMAAKTFMRSEIGAMVPLFVNPMFHNMGFQYAGLLLALLALAIAPIPFVFYKYGERIRMGSKRASKNRRIRDEDVGVSEKGQI